MNQLIDTERLQALRVARGWDRHTLATRAGISPSVITRIERGLQTDLRVSILLALAVTLDVPLDALVLRPQALSGPLQAELSAALLRLETLSQAQQRQVAALLIAYVATASSETGD